VSIGKDPVSAENNDHIAQEQELWERMSTTEGRERAEVLDELSHIAYKKDNYTECLHLVDTSIGIYYKLGGADVYLKELIHLYKGMCHCYEHLKRFEDAAGAFEHLSGLYFIDEDHEGQIWAARAAARAWYEVKEWQKSLDGHIAATKLIDPDATPFSMGMDQLNIGMALVKLKRDEESVVAYLGSRKLFKEAKSPEYVNWCDDFLSQAYFNLENGLEAKFHAQHFLNYSKVAENLRMEGYARYRLGGAFLICQEYVEAEKHLTRALELLTLEDDKDWEDIIAANKELAKALVALGREDEANERLERIKGIEETISD
jgi:tetratricopeptide (TPR) repeat protein